MIVVIITKTTTLTIISQSVYYRIFPLFVISHIRIYEVDVKRPEIVFRFDAMPVTEYRVSTNAIDTTLHT